jgi:hypothetical protein
MTHGVWGPERDAALRHKFLIEGLTATQIAEQWGVTRNTIAGRLDKLKIRRGQQSAWTPERLAILRELVLTTHPDEIAKAINAEAGRAMSGSAVYSKASRLGLLKKRERKARPKPEKRTNGTVGSLAAKTIFGIKRRLNIPKDGDASEPSRPAWSQGIPFSSLQPFMERETNECRYPSGVGPDVVFCGQPTPEGEPYCDACRRLCYLGRRHREITDQHRHKLKAHTARVNHIGRLRLAMLDVYGDAA